MTGRPWWQAPPVCSCGHGEAEHEHWREGEDCSHPGCDCTGFTPPLRELLRAWWERVRWNW